MIKHHVRKIKFSLVSFIATTIDLLTLLILTNFGMPIILANYPSTSAGFIFSFFANKKFTFRTPDHHIQREAVLFLVVTIVGIWIIQPVLILGLQKVLGHFEFIDWVEVVTAKLIASIATFFWNYLFYSRLVFIRKK